MANVRSSNIELLRIVLMTMIVLWHFIVHGMGYAREEIYESDSFSLITLLVCPLLCYHVNTFVFISGYFSINFNLKKYVRFLAMLAFYGLCSYLLYLLVYYKNDFWLHIKASDWKVLFAGSNGMWWFITNYLFLMCLAPLINRGWERTNLKEQRKLLLLSGFFVCSGIAYYEDYVNPTMTFVFMYLLGRYFRQVEVKYAWLLWGVSVSLLMLHVIYLYMTEPLSLSVIAKTMSYNHPFCITASVGFFFMFKNLKLPSVACVNKIAAGVLSAYLLTDGWLQGAFNYKMVAIFGPNILALTCVAFAVVLLCSGFDMIRSFIEEKILARLERDN